MDEIKSAEQKIKCGLFWKLKICLQDTLAFLSRKTLNQFIFIQILKEVKSFSSLLWSLMCLIFLHLAEH